MEDTVTNTNNELVINEHALLYAPIIMSLKSYGKSFDYYRVQSLKTMHHALSARLLL